MVDERHRPETAVGIAALGRLENLQRHHCVVVGSRQPAHRHTEPATTTEILHLDTNTIARRETIHHLCDRRAGLIGQHRIA